VDRLYLNGYVPLLQAPGHITTFCRQQLNAPIASPALFRPLLERFTHAVERFRPAARCPDRKVLQTRLPLFFDEVKVAIPAPAPELGEATAAMLGAGRIARSPAREGRVR
jgi:hypothetical protein